MCIKKTWIVFYYKCAIWLWRKEKFPNLRWGPLLKLKVLLFHLIVTIHFKFLWSFSETVLQMCIKISYFWNITFFKGHKFNSFGKKSKLFFVCLTSMKLKIKLNETSQIFKTFPDPRWRPTLKDCVIPSVNDNLFFIFIKT